MALLCLLAMSVLVNLRLTASDYYHCYSSSNSSSSGEDKANRNSLLYLIPAHAMDQGGYYYTHTSNISNVHGTPTEYCLGLCRKDQVASQACSDCLTSLVYGITGHCLYQKEVIAWGGDALCVVRCAPHEFPRMFETSPVVPVCNASNVSQIELPRFDRAVANLTTSISERAAAHMSNYFATGEVKLADFRTIYGVGFCLPTLAPSSCTGCLLAAMNQSEKHCHGRQGATILTPSCIFRYELYDFYESSSSVAPLSSPPVSSPSVFSNEGKKSRTHVLSMVVPIIVVLLVMALITCTTIIFLKKHKGELQDVAESTESCLEFSLQTVKVATNDFSVCNKLGQGGFGAVYKGTLQNDQKIAVKRLTVRSLRGEMEFKNEVQLLARLHHKNLIRLIGYCLEGKERLLIYELAINGSLDRLLFDSIRREYLTWEIRYNIIQGITRGMVYLHEESQLRIIHRDLKASNVLLDECLNPKISDFGTARLYVEKQGSASKIVGTYGYMSPEYVKHGKISMKMDVFSFGVLLLEIVCGKRNSGSKNPTDIDHLLSKAWKYWHAGNLLEIIDPMLQRASHQTEEITRCIHIGLLCVQEDATSRPSMNLVLQMIEGCSQNLSPPLKPAYYMDFGDEEVNMLISDEEHSIYSRLDPRQHVIESLLGYNSVPSVNEISITQPYPETR